MAKNYITILGIFASIVVSFVAGIVFSTSVLEHMHSVSIYRLIFVILLLSLILMNVINLLVVYIFKITCKLDEFPIEKYNIIICVLMVLVFACWVFQVHELPFYLSKHYPWIEKICIFLS